MTPALFTQWDSTMATLLVLLMEESAALSKTVLLSGPVGELLGQLALLKQECRRTAQLISYADGHHPDIYEALVRALGRL